MVSGYGNKAGVDGGGVGVGAPGAGAGCGEGAPETRTLMMTMIVLLIANLCESNVSGFKWRLSSSSNPLLNVLKVNRMFSSNSTTNKYRAGSECSFWKNHLKSQDGIILTLNVSRQSQTYHTSMRTPLPMYRLTCTRHRGSSPSFDKTEANALHPPLSETTWSAACALQPPALPFRQRPLSVSCYSLWGSPLSHQLPFPGSRMPVYVERVPKRPFLDKKKKRRKNKIPYGSAFVCWLNIPETSADFPMWIIEQDDL
jgi:hypothetical protein